MGREFKYTLNNAPAVERRGIYEYENASGTYNGLCLVVAGNHRQWDKYVSGISLSPCDTDTGKHSDEIGLRLPDGREFWVHCGMVTYFRRDRLGEMVHKISKGTMGRINEKMKQELGLSPKLEIMPDDEPDYEKLYKDLIRTIASWNGIVKKHAVRRDENG